MLRLGRTIRRLAIDENGITSIEYGLIAALIAVGMVVAVTAMGTELENMYEILIAAQIDAAVT